MSTKIVISLIFYASTWEPRAHTNRPTVTRVPRGTRQTLHHRQLAPPAFCQIESLLVCGWAWLGEIKMDCRFHSCLFLCILFFPLQLSLPMQWILSTIIVIGINGTAAAAVAVDALRASVCVM